MKSGAKEPVHVTKDHLVKEDRAGEGELRGGLAVGSRGTDKSMKKEDMDMTNTKNRQDRPRSISISTRGGNKTSKTSTPTQGSFNDTQRTRPTRNADPAKRSHKKGAGLAAQLVAAQLATEDDDPSIHGDGDEDEDEGDTEPRYCYCNQVSYGEMVACDMATCPREWFHLDCVGLTKAPKGNGESSHLKVIRMRYTLQILTFSQPNGFVMNVKRILRKARLLIAMADDRPFSPLPGRWQGIQAECPSSYRIPRFRAEAISPLLSFGSTWPSLMYRMLTRSAIILREFVKLESDRN